MITRMRRRGTTFAVALALALATATGPPAAAAGRARVRSPSTERAPAAALKPDVVWKKIPFGAKRRHQMAAYSKRHYGKRAWRLSDPRVIVEHYTAGSSAQSAWNYFAANVRHLGEMPGVCSHFLVNTDGTIYQLVNLGIRCRHAIGMNWTAIGIEMVGTSDAQILHRRPQLRAALHLTLWLMARFGIGVGNVIGHAETLRSPYHHERYASWRCLTHADWQHTDMQTFRRKLRRMARRAEVPAGPKPVWVDPGC